ncbi:MAG: hypothetical protein ACOYOS_00040 [Syntrophales bacterium]
MDDIEGKVGELSKENAELKKRVSMQNKIISHLSKLEDMGSIERDTRSGFMFYYAHRQAHFKNLYGMPYNPKNAELVYNAQEAIFRKNRGMNKYPCDIRVQISRELK